MFVVLCPKLNYLFRRGCTVFVQRSRIVCCMPDAFLVVAAAAAGFALFGYHKISVSLERYFMSTQAAIDAVVAQLVKAKDEIVGKLEEATAGVEAQLVEAGVEDVVDLSALTAIAQQLDDLVPYAVVEETDEVDETDEFEVDETDEFEVDETDEVEVEETDEVEVEETDEFEVDEAVEETEEGDEYVI